jgi:hypothetical protein
MPKESSFRKPKPVQAIKFPGPIIDVRFIQLRDGRKIMQYSKMPGVWDTPETVDILSLQPDQQDEIREVLHAAHDPNIR